MIKHFNFLSYYLHLMTAITPIIKKNLIYSKRNILRTLLQLFYPCILLWIFAMMYDATEDIPMESKTFYEYSTMIDPSQTYYFDDIFSNSEENCYAIIGKDEHYRKKITSFLMEDSSKDFSLNNLEICIGDCKVFTFQSEKDFNTYIKRPIYRNETGTISYIIKFNENLEFSLSAPDLLLRSEWSNLNEFNIVPDLPKLDSTSSVIQDQFTVFLTKFLFSEKEQTTWGRKLQLTSTPMKSPSIHSSIDNTILNSIIPVILSISYISILFQFVLWLVAEKEKKLKDLLIRQGVTTTQYMLSWLYTFVLLTIIPIIVNSVLLKFYFFQKTNIIFIFLNLFFFSLNILGMALVFHQFVSDIRSGQSLLKLVYISFSILSAVISREGVSYIFRYVFSIFPQTVLKSSFEIFLSTKNFENGLDWTMMFAYYKGVNMFILYSIYIADFVLYVLFAYFLQGYSQSGLGLCDYLLSFCITRKRKILSKDVLSSQNNTANKNSKTDIDDKSKNCNNHSI